MKARQTKNTSKPCRDGCVVWLRGLQSCTPCAPFQCNGRAVCPWLSAVDACCGGALRRPSTMIGRKASLCQGARPTGARHQTAPPLFGGLSSLRRRGFQETSGTVGPRIGSSQFAKGQFCQTTTANPSHRVADARIPDGPPPSERDRPELSCCPRTSRRFATAPPPSHRGCDRRGLDRGAINSALAFLIAHP